ncbi:MAG: 23S rRNA (adenine(1618)-N(6))-methyltransferase RlmF [Roseibacillus sp.]
MKTQELTGSGDGGGALHPRNPHRGRYRFDGLCEALPSLQGFLRLNPRGEQTIDFADPAAVVALNQALLSQFYGVKHWMIPKGYLCPPIPGRADYIHYLADLIGEKDGVTVLDIGTGANCVYPIIGSQAYGWKFVGTDIDPVSVKTARTIVEVNPCLRKKVKIVLQKSSQSYFEGVIREGDCYELTMCNPPFHSSMEDAQAGSRRKVRNLQKSQSAKGKLALNFGGQGGELWCPGGELAFLKGMIRESQKYSQQVGWFTSLVSKADTLKPLQKLLERHSAKEVRVVSMSQGQKQSRFIAWRF